MKKGLLLFCLVPLLFLAHAQDYPLFDSLKQNLANARSAADKVKWLGELSQSYMNLNPSASEQYGKQLMEVAELSRDRKLMIKAMLSQANQYYNSGGVQANINKAKSYSKQALELAKSSNLDEYIARSYTYMARGARNEGENDKALNYSNLAVSIASGVDNDTLKISCYRSLGDTYQSRDEKLLAFRNYLQAVNLAEQSNNYEAIKSCYYRMSSFYSDLEEHEKAKDYLFRMFRLTLQNHDRWARLGLYNTIGSVYAQSKQFDLAADFYDRSIKLADTLNFAPAKLNVYGNMFDLYFTSNQPDKALRYFREKKDLTDFVKNAGFYFYIDHAYAVAYTGIKKYDSAAYYFKLCEPDFEAKANSYNKYHFYRHYADFLTKTGNHKKSLEYWLKAKRIGDERSDIGILQNTAMHLDSVYQHLGDFKSAYYYQTKYNLYKDSLESLATEKDLLALEVNDENKRKEREILQAEDDKRLRHNVQYMGITAAIAAVFIVLVMLGAFSVSKTTIRILGFFAFIFLFEFIILLADHQIHDWTHGEPWKILAIKIGLISILLPLHHFMEERVIHYLTSRKMLEVNAKGLLNKLAGKGETDPVLKN